jgi:L-lactate dehydrogenase (cytochrome)
MALVRRRLPRWSKFRPLLRPERIPFGVSTADTGTVLGRGWPLPFALAPTGFTRMMHHEGERAAVRAARRVGVTYALSAMGTTSIGQVADEAPGLR